MDSAQQTLHLQVARGWNGFAYVCAGSGRICGTQGSCEHALVFGPGDHVTATSNDEEGLRFLLVAGQPIGEPVVQYGPFVMNTQVGSFSSMNCYNWDQGTGRPGTSVQPCWLAKGVTLPPPPQSTRKYVARSVG